MTTQITVSGDGKFGVDSTGKKLPLKIEKKMQEQVFAFENATVPIGEYSAEDHGGFWFIPIAPSGYVRKYTEEEERYHFNRYMFG